MISPYAINNTVATSSQIKKGKFPRTSHTPHGLKAVRPWGTILCYSFGKVFYVFFGNCNMELLWMVCKYFCMMYISTCFFSGISQIPPKNVCFGSTASSNSDKSRFLGIPEPKKCNVILLVTRNPHAGARGGRSNVC